MEVTGQQSNHSVKARLDRLHGWAGVDQVVRARDETREPSCAVPSAPRRRQRRLEPERVKDLIAAYSGGVAVDELARQFAVHRSTVLDHLNRSNARRRYPALDEGGVKEAVQLYRSGVSLRGIGTRLGVHASTVRLTLLRVGVRTRDR